MSCACRGGGLLEDDCPNYATELIVADSWSIGEIIHRISSLVD
jgi:hypothetical protein